MQAVIRLPGTSHNFQLFKKFRIYLELVTNKVAYLINKIFNCNILDKCVRCTINLTRARWQRNNEKYQNIAYRPATTIEELVRSPTNVT